MRYALLQFSPAVAQPIDLHMKTILVVDDMPPLRQAIVAALQQKGYQTVCADDERAAIESLNAQSFDLILLDVHVSALGDAAFQETLEANGTSVAVITAISERGRVDQALAHVEQATAGDAPTIARTHVWHIVRSGSDRRDRSPHGQRRKARIPA